MFSELFGVVVFCLGLGWGRMFRKGIVGLTLSVLLVLFGSIGRRGLKFEIEVFSSFFGFSFLFV